jgi:hypothetical protein
VRLRSASSGINPQVRCAQMYFTRDVQECQVQPIINGSPLLGYKLGMGHGQQRLRA